MLRSVCGVLLFLILLPFPSEAVSDGSYTAAEGTAEAHAGPADLALPGLPPALQAELLRKRTEKTYLPGPPIPVDPTKPLGAEPPANQPTLSGAQFQMDGEAPQAPSDFQFYLRKGLSTEIPTGYTSAVHEPSVATKGNTVFLTGNWFGALSTDGGQTFAFRNPTQGPFAGASNFCCDQVAIYSPGRDAIFYLQQLTKGSGVQRLNVDRGGNGTFDCYYDFAPQHLGYPAGSWLDYPDLVLGSNYLYHTTNVFRGSDDVFIGGVIARYPLDGIASCAPQFNYSYLPITDRGSFRATHGAGPVMYWATHNSNTSLRIYRWAESSPSISFDDRSLSSAWNPGNYACPDSFGKDFCRRSDGRVHAAYLANGILGFLWNGGAGGFFPYPQVQVARFRESDRGLVEHTQIWNPSAAWMYPSVSVNARGHLAGTVLYGGGSSTPSCNAWIADDYNGGGFAPLENWEVARSTHGPDQPVGGDYLTTRTHSPHANTWVGTCYSFQGGGSDFHAKPYYVWFGRQRDNVTQSSCQAGASTLCLVGGRFKVEVSWRTRTGSSGVGTVVPATDNTGIFWFFNSTNYELMVKVLDARALNGKFWVFYGALSDVEYWINVTDTQTGATKTYHNPQGSISGGADTSAF